MQNHCVIFRELVSSMGKNNLLFILLKLANVLVSFNAMHHLFIIHTVKTVTEFLNISRLDSAALCFVLEEKDTTALNIF